MRTTTGLMRFPACAGPKGTREFAQSTRRLANHISARPPGLKLAEAVHGSLGKFWGTAIYGQCDPAFGPQALATAYDLGARYFWFWTSDHGHHVPWPEQIALARSIKAHAASHRRRSIYLPQPKRATVIAIPEGYFLTSKNLSWVRALADPQAEPAQNFRRVRRRAFAAVEQCYDRGEDFDITVADGGPVTGYRRIVGVTDRP